MKTFDIRDYGAVADGKTLNTKAIQACIDACAAAGGGQVVVEGGTYMTGTIRLHSFIDFHLEANATLLGSPRCEDYPAFTDCVHIDAEKCPRKRASCLIFADEAKNVSISGNGTIDGNGTYFVRPKPYVDHWKKYERIGLDTPPRVVFFAGCQHARITDISIVNQPSGWAYWIHDCDDVVMTRLRVYASFDYPNNDGIHINSSRDVFVSDCSIQASDDALIVRANNISLPENKVCERITVTNCNLLSHCGAIRIGWINDGIVRNCTFSNLNVTDSKNGVLFTLPWRGPDRIPDEGREDTVIDNITFENIVMDRIHSYPIFINVDDRDETRIRCKAISRIWIRGMRSRGLKFPSIKGSRFCKISDFYLDGCVFEKEERTAEYGDYLFIQDEYKDRCPENDTTEGFFNVKNLFVNNTRFIDNTPDEEKK